MFRCLILMFLSPDVAQCYIFLTALSINNAFCFAVDELKTLKQRLHIAGVTTAFVFVVTIS